MGGALPTKTIDWRVRVAALLLVLFALQSTFRLIVMFPPFQRSNFHFPAVHALDLIAMCGGAIILLHFAQKRKLLQFLLALVLGAISMVLLAFDISSFVAVWFHQRVLPLATVPVFYCNAPTISSCIRPFPGIALTIAGIWLSWSMLIYYAADALAALNTRLLRPFTLSGRIKRLPFVLIALFLTAWGGMWLATPGELSAREPLFRFLFKNPDGAQPRALIDIARPNYEVKPSANIKPRLLVLISIDSLRADAVGMAAGRQSLTPFLQSLSASGKLHDFGPAVAICPTSYCGITGLLSSSNWARLQKGPPLSIADILAANGYKNHYLLSGPHIRVLNLAKLYGPNITTMLDDSSADSSGLIDDREQVRRLEKLKLPDPRRSFIFIHLMSAHAAGLRFDRSIASSGSSSTARYTGEYQPYYNRGVRQADQMLSQLFGALKRRGLLDDALIVITSDHGERTVGVTGHGGQIDLATALVPMLVYDGRGEKWPKASSGLTSQADAAPTLLAAAGIETPKHWYGSALQFGVTRTAATMDSEDQSGLVGRIDGQIVFIRCDLRKGRLRVFAADESLSQKALAAYPLWARGQAHRQDATHCDDHAPR